MILRNFLYLDSSTVSDYLSSLDGSIVEGPVDHTQSAKHDKGLKASLKIAEGSLSGCGASETKEKRVVTDAAKFQRLYDLIAQDHVQYLDAFDDAIWQQIRRGELLELQCTIRIPEFFKMTQIVDAFAPMIDIFKAVEAAIVDAKTEAAIKGFGGLSKMLSGKPVPLIFEPVSTPGYHFVAELRRQFLRCEMSELQGEATVLGKVLRTLSKSQTHEVFSLFPASIPIMDSKVQKQLQRDLKSNKLSEVVRGPGAILAAVAVYR
jgi:hypothetical protein